MRGRRETTTVELAANGPFEVVLRGASRRERIAILRNRRFHRSPEAQQLFQSVAAVALLAGHMPDRVRMSFPIVKETRRLIDRMYQTDGLPPPSVIAPARIQPHPIAGSRAPLDGALVAYSGGHDSLWNFEAARQQFGPRRVRAAHVAGLCRLVGREESRWSRRQFNAFGTPNVIVTILNGSRSVGSTDMKARDVLLFGLLAPVAAALQCGTILTEGFCETRPDEPFSAQPGAIALVEAAVRAFGFPVAIRGLECRGMEKYSDLFHESPERMPLLFSCESMAMLRTRRRRAWRRQYPSMRLYGSQCGTCTKCYVFTLARLLGDASLRWHAADVRRFLRSLPPALAAKSDLVPLPIDFHASYRDAVRRFALDDAASLIERMARTISPRSVEVVRGGAQR